MSKKSEGENTLTDLLLQTQAENDDIFDELRGVETLCATCGEDPCTCQAQPSAQPSAQSSAPSPTSEADQGDGEDNDSAAAAVERALRAVEPDFQSNQESREKVSADAPSGQRLLPVSRPSGEDYRPRIIRHLTDIELLQKARQAESPVLLSGYPGCGKTALVEAAFSEDLLTAHAHGDMEVTDLVGTYTQQPDGSYLWVDGPLVEAMKSGSVLFIDDITLAPATVLARLYPGMDGRKEIRVVEHESEVVRAEEGFFVVGAHNPGAPGAILSEALSSRFTVPMVVDSDLRMALDMGVDSRVVNATAALHKLRSEGQLLWAPEMREMLAYQRNREAFGEEIAIDALIGSAPEETRDTIAATLRTWFPEAETLRLRAR